MTVVRRHLAEAAPQAPGVPRRVRRAATLPFEVAESKLHVPVLRSGTVSRTGLVNRLRARHDFSVATIVAPAGYGKTTLLAQWATRDRRPFAWISIDERDDDPIVLLRHLGAAVHAIRPLEAAVIDALAAPGPSMWEAALPRLGAALSAFEEPLVIVVDDAHLMRSREASEAIAAVSDHLSAGSMLVLAGRSAPTLPIASLRATGRLLELGIPQLALTPREGQLVLRSTGADLSLAETTELVKHCEGWPAGLYLAALALREDGTRRRRGERPLDLRRSDRPLEDYLRAEYLARMRPGALRFLERTSVLDRMCGALCDAVLQDQGSSAALEKIERSNLFLIPLDRHRVWYRYHHVFRDLLRRDLAEREPELVPVLHRRAAAWFEAQGDLESALVHADAAGDLDRVAQIVATIALPAYSSGRVATVEGWFARFDEPELLARYPDVALQGAFVHVLRGRPQDADRWLSVAEARPDGPAAPLRASIAAVRATMAKDGVDQMVADAETALAGVPPESVFRPTASIARGIGWMLVGQNEQADALFAAAAAEAERLCATDAQIVAVTERSLIAAARADHAVAESFAAEARELAERSQLDTYATSAVTLAVAARAALRHGRWDEARALLAKVHGLRERLTRTQLPWLAVQTLIEEARAYLALRDTASVESVLEEVRRLLREHPDLGALADQAEALERDVEGIPSRTDAAAVGLTSAELRLLPFLATHLSFREIGEALFVSRNTVKTQAISVYRKLGVTSRSEAIVRAVDLGLVEDAAEVP